MKSINRKIVISIILCISTFIVKKLVFKVDIFEILYWLIVMGWIFPISYEDYKKHIIPNKYLLWMLRIAIPVFMVQIVVYSDYVIAISLIKALGILIGGGLFLLSMLISPNGIGAGDVKLYAVIGFLLGAKAIINVLLYALILGAICSVVLLLMKKKTRNDELPLAPYTMFSLIFSLIVGV